jgi:hypothetical protein
MIGVEKKTHTMKAFICDFESLGTASWALEVSEKTTTAGLLLDAGPGSVALAVKPSSVGRNVTKIIARGMKRTFDNVLTVPNLGQILIFRANPVIFRIYPNACTKPSPFIFHITPLLLTVHPSALGLRRRIDRTGVLPFL